VIRLSDGEVVEDRRLAGVHDPPPAAHALKVRHPVAGAVVEAQP